jgi:hypothetical protein
MSTEEIKKGLKAVFPAVLILGSALPFGYLGRPTEMGLALLAGGIAAALVNIDKIQRVKGGVFEAEMRKAVDEAYATTDALRRLAKVVLRSTLQILTMLGRVQDMPATQKHEFRNEIERLGKEMGIAEDEAVRSAHELFFWYQTWDHFHDFAHACRQARVPASERLWAMLNYSSNGPHPTLQEINAVLGNDTVLDASCRGRLEDYLHYLKHRTLRRPEALS